MSSTRISRRRFLETSAAAGVTLAGLPAILQAGERNQDNKKRDPFGGFTVGMQSYTFRNFKLDQALQRTADLGLHFIELYRGHLPVTATDEQIKAARNLCIEHNITPIAFGVEGFSKDHAANRRI